MVVSVCEFCGHALIDHPFDRCIIPGCKCKRPCKVCSHAKIDHFMGLCGEPGCTCMFGKMR